MEIEEEIKSPQNAKLRTKGSLTVENGENRDSIISPRFRSVAAMAGWDEEALLLASLIVEDTPERDSNHKKRTHFQLKSPSISSRRKCRARRQSSASLPIVVLNLDDEKTVREDNDVEKNELNIAAIREKKGEVKCGDALPIQDSSVSCLGSSLPCMDRLKEELSCAICLEICFEPSTTPCGHSFCKKCLRSAADKCGKKCPKCRQLISNGRSCTVNTVLWNTIQLLFPQEVEARKAAGALNNREAESRSSEKGNYGSTRSQSTPSFGGTDVNVRRRRDGLSQAQDARLAFRLPREENLSAMGRDIRPRRRRGAPSQVEDAALAFRLQREEFAEAFRGTHEQSSSLSSARTNLRAMATRAINLRIRGWQG